jgi:glycosyltransferase involved in cell wall biosynthesis
VKILWHSNAPWVPTGYGQQTAMFGPRIRDAGHDVTFSACWGLGGARLEWEGMPVYPSDDKWGNRTLNAIARIVGDGEPCQVITLLDVWPLTANFTGLDIATWVPIDHAPVPPNVGAFYERNPHATPIAMSRFGERMLRDAGLDPLYVPHGIDTNVFRPRFGPKSAHLGKTRKKMNLPEDAFVVGMVANNQGTAPPRKAFPQVFMAFSMLVKEHPNAYLYLHTELTGHKDGINLGELANACGIPPDRVKCTNPMAYEFGIEPDMMSLLYSAFDVLACPSYGEGFGIPIVESQACGTPVIVTDATAMTELCGSGWLVGGDPWYDPSQGAFFTCPSVMELHAAMEAAYQSRGDQAAREKAREFALGYDADRVMETYWLPVLAALEQRDEPSAPAAPEIEVFEEAA